MVVVTVEEAQKNLAKLLTDVAAGEEVVIERDHVPLGRLLPIPSAEPDKGQRQFGQFAGRIHIRDDFDDPLDEFADYI